MFALRSLWSRSAATVPVLLCAHRTCHDPPSGRTVLRDGAPPDATAPLQLAPPSSFTHAALTIVRCPVCGARQGLETLFQHLASAHPQAHPLSTYQALCLERLALYEEVMGSPFLSADERQRSGLNTLLPSAESTEDGAASPLASSPAHRASAPSPSSSTPPVTAAAAPTAFDITSDRDAWRAQLPTVTAHGSYVCNWCTVRATFRTRDAFLLHVCGDHPLLDVELVEPLVPMPPPPPSASSALSAHRPAHWDDTSSAARGWGSPASVPQTTVTGTVTGTGVVPLRRVLPGAFGRHTDAAVPATHKTVLRSPRPGTVGLPRSLDSTMSLTEMELPMEAGPRIEFGVDGFPCELCQRRFSSELGLLNHLLTSHKAGATASATTTRQMDGETGLHDDPEATLRRRLKADVRRSRQPTQSTISPSLTAAARLQCDLCTHGKKVYTLPSALFAHIRFTHPREDAGFHVERITKAAQYAQQTQLSHATDAANVEADGSPEDETDSRFPCVLCARVFNSAEARRVHLEAKHHIAPTLTAARTAPASASAAEASSSLPPVSLKTVWWCSDCEKGFSSARALISHAVGKHQRPLEALPCPACKRVLADSYALEEHMKAAHPSLHFDDLGLRTDNAACPSCQRRFLSVEDLQRHTARHHHNHHHQTSEAVAKPALPTAPSMVSADAESRAGWTTAATPASVPTAATPSAAQALITPAVPRKVSRRTSRSASV